MRLAMILLLAGCSAPPAPAPAATIVRPDLPRVCPEAPAAVLPPKKPRTFDAVVAWAQGNEQRRADSFHDLEICRARLTQWVEWGDGVAP